LDIFIKDELDKCVILCQNCHHEKHTDIEKFNKLKEEIYHKVNNYKEISKKIPRCEVKKMYKNGIKQIDIAKHFETCKSTISNIIKELNINKEHRIDIDEVKKLYDTGLKAIDISRKLNINKNSIYGVIRKLKK